MVSSTTALLARHMQQNAAYWTQQPPEKLPFPPRRVKASELLDFRITSEAIHRMQADTPGARGDQLLDALLAWMKPDRQLGRDSQPLRGQSFGQRRYVDRTLRW